MKKEDLINELQKLPDGVEVCVFDWRKNLGDDIGDGSHAGIYSDVEVSMVSMLSDDELVFYEENNGIEYRPWASISFNSEDYDDCGRCVQ